MSRVVDGDTVEVSKGGRELTVRLIGIDTPETVHPTEPIECYGPEASSFASRVLNDRRVLLEFDPSQGRLDYYGRTLAYLWLDGQRLILFNKQAVRRGFALEYTYNSAYQWQSQLQRAEKRAQRQKLGVWQCPTPGS
ncbi:MAG: thermonuclease family protein [Actinomycetes bacterium]